jgi:hypothetical protein
MCQPSTAGGPTVWTWTRKNDPAGQPYKFETRSRFSEALPASYWCAAWGTLQPPSNATPRQRAQLARYQAAGSLPLFREYLSARVRALR